MLNSGIVILRNRQFHILTGSSENVAPVEKCNVGDQSLENQ